MVTQGGLKRTHTILQCKNSKNLRTVSTTSNGQDEDRRRSPVTDTKRMAKVSVNRVPIRRQDFHRGRYLNQSVESSTHGPTFYIRLILRKILKSYLFGLSESHDITTCLSNRHYYPYSSDVDTPSSITHIRPLDTRSSLVPSFIRFRDTLPTTKSKPTKKLT